MAQLLKSNHDNVNVKTVTSVNDEIKEVCHISDADTISHHIALMLVMIMQVPLVV